MNFFVYGEMNVAQTWDNGFCWRIVNSVSHTLWVQLAHLAGEWLEAGIAVGRTTIVE